MGTIHIVKVFLSFFTEGNRAWKIAEEYEAHKAKWILQVLSGHLLEVNLRLHPIKKG